MDVNFQEKETKKQSFNIKCFNNRDVCVDFVASDFTLFKGFLRNIFNFFYFWQMKSWSGYGDALDRIKV